MAKTKTSAGRIAAIITVTLAVIACYGLAVTLFGMTLVSPLWIVVAVVAIAAATAYPFARKWEALTASRNVALNAGCHIVAFAGLLMALILGVNYFGRDTAKSATVRARVVKVYSETRYRTKRVARNRYTRGEPYQVHFMEVRLPDGRVRKRSIPLRQYVSYARTGRRPDSVDLRLTKGALGMTVIERDNSRMNHKTI